MRIVRQKLFNDAGFHSQQPDWNHSYVNPNQQGTDFAYYNGKGTLRLDRDITDKAWKFRGPEKEGESGKSLYKKVKVNGKTQHQFLGRARFQMDIDHEKELGHPTRLSFMEGGSNKEKASQAYKDFLKAIREQEKLGRTFNKEDLEKMKADIKNQIRSEAKKEARNKILKKVGIGAAVAGGLAYGGKKLYDNYKNEND